MEKGRTKRSLIEASVILLLLVVVAIDAIGFTGL